ncbi:MAG: RNA pseudouridine synthase [Magnetococcales bacterium]|nr:RNA pseudouridine synthase [Magnetococcales bacterium]
MTKAELQERILYRDGLILVINKPAGIAVHGPPGGGEALENYFDALRFGLPRRPSLAHRLDRATSGCLVLGRHPKALRKVGRLFASGQIHKRYWAMASSEPPEEEGLIDLPLQKITGERHQWRMVVDDEGKPSQTDYRLLGRGAAGFWLELKPRTGRTHQLRVHCAQMGFPLVGDTLYGERQPGQSLSLQLHAREVAIPLSKRRPPIVVTAPPPAHMLPLLESCGYLPTSSP